MSDDNNGFVGGASLDQTIIKYQTLQEVDWISPSPNATHDSFMGKEWWEKVVKGMCTVTSCACLTLIHFKVTYRVHFSKSNLAELYQGVGDKCERCSSSTCHISHMFSSVHICTTFGLVIFILPQSSWVYNFDHAHLASFGTLDESFCFTPVNPEIIKLTSLLAGHRLLVQWKFPNHPTIAQWLKYSFLSETSKNQIYSQRKYQQVLP